MALYSLIVLNADVPLRIYSLAAMHHARAVSLCEGVSCPAGQSTQWLFADVTDKL